ncbi:MAG: YHS domain-containing protein [Candidatus Omnitrophica bacterium]|nr:YHS domain-containing protein [Candidatus Omnitrophota bacterium]
MGYRYKGKKYKFCSMGCLKAFKADPEKFLSDDYEEQGHMEENPTDKDQGKHKEDDHAGHDH